MSEEILKALTQLFAIITKQDGGVTENERAYVIRFFEKQLDQDSVNEYVELYDKLAEYDQNQEKSEEKPAKLTSVRDSVKTLALCKKINKTLDYEQKVIVLIRILELVASDHNFTPQRIQIIDTVSEVFEIKNKNYRAIELFVKESDPTQLDFPNLLIVNNEERYAFEEAIHIPDYPLKGDLVFLKINVDEIASEQKKKKKAPVVEKKKKANSTLYFFKYTGDLEVSLNDSILIDDNEIYLYSEGGKIKPPNGKPLYYSKIVDSFTNDGKQIDTIQFEAKNVQFTFPNGTVGLQNINISENGGLLGIMGASGAGKTTLLNVLSGLETPSEGKVCINGLDVHNDKQEIEGVIGYVAQDDLLIEELTVFQNLFYNAKLCFKDKTDDEITKLVEATLSNLGLLHIKDVTVGSPLNKKISGGQRKRLNIALELIREPTVLFVDEPTSGLSSRDSENVVDLLKELGYRGKLIFVVIHQPSSDIFKMFDKFYILDTGGFPIFYGSPIEAVQYFRRKGGQDDPFPEDYIFKTFSPEEIFNVVEAKVIDEYGRFTDHRKKTPKQWSDLYDKEFELKSAQRVGDKPPQTLKLPNKLKQTIIFTIRDTLSKLANRQYLLINLLEAPLLAFILAFVIRYRSAPDGAKYIFRFNDNIPAFLLMAIIVALFMGLTVSAEEIIRDRKILKRESFLNLSWNSYLISKLLILFTLSAIQTVMFVIVGNLVLEIRGMTFTFWMALFSTACFANVLGLNVSSAFNSAVTVYIMIPLLLIPQMILSGLLFSYDKLNEVISNRGEVPLLADIMASRWAYEAMAVHQFKTNEYQAIFYDIEQKERQSDFKASYFISELQDKVRSLRGNIGKTDDNTRTEVLNDWLLLKNELAKEPSRGDLNSLDFSSVDVDQLTQDILNDIEQHLKDLEDYHRAVYNEAASDKDKIFAVLPTKFNVDVNDLKNKYYNESLSDLVRNINTEERIIEYKGRLVQEIDPIFNISKQPRHLLDYRTHFFAPQKYILGLRMNTFIFNLLVIWFMTFLLYLSLYFELLRKSFEALGKIKLKK